MRSRRTTSLPTILGSLAGDLFLSQTARWIRSTWSPKYLWGQPKTKGGGEITIPSSGIWNNHSQFWNLCAVTAKGDAISQWRLRSTTCGWFTPQVPWAQTLSQRSLTTRISPVGYSHSGWAPLWLLTRTKTNQGLRHHLVLKRGQWPRSGKKSTAKLQKISK